MHARTHAPCPLWSLGGTRTHRERDTRKHAHTITYHVAHSNPHTASKLLHQRVIVCGEECSALDALSKLTHNSTGYGSPVICSCPSACREKAVGETDQVNPQSQSVSGHHKWEISLPPALLSFIYHSIIHTYVRMYNIHHCHCKMRCGWRERFQIWSTEEQCVCECTEMRTLFSACYWTIALTEDQACITHLQLPWKAARWQLFLLVPPSGSCTGVLKSALSPGSRW